jgi:hypothetical protein
MSRGVPRKKKIYAPQALLRMGFLDIFPRAINRLSIRPAETARTVRSIVILAPFRREGIQEIIR